MFSSKTDYNKALTNLCSDMTEAENLHYFRTKPHVADVNWSLYEGISGGFTCLIIKHYGFC